MLHLDSFFIRRKTGMSIFCSYHPTRPAEWECEYCDQLLCNECIIHRRISRPAGESVYHICPKCNREATWLGIANLLTPFWNRLPHFFVYPFFFKPLILNVVLCVLTYFFMGCGVVDVLVRFAIWGVWLKYSFASLQTTAKGNLTPPPITLDNISNNFEDVFKQLVLYLILIVGLIFITAATTPFFGIILAVVCFTCLPAMIILLVSTGSMVQALNPVAFTVLPFRIGWGYLIMYFFLAILAGAPAALFKMTAPFIPGLLLPFLIIFFQNYYTLISYNLMGYVLLQYHEEIGYDVDYEDFVTEESGSTPDVSAMSPFLNEVEIRIKDGEYEQAENMLEKEIRENSSKDLDVLGRYYELLKLGKKTSQIPVHGKLYLEELIKAEDKDTACRVFLECTRIDNQFAPSPKAFVKLAGWLKNTGHIKEAIRAYAAFNRIYSKDPMVPIVCFRAAELFNDRLGQKAKADTLLKGILKQYPDHDIIPFVESYLKKLQA